MQHAASGLRCRLRLFFVTTKSHQPPPSCSARSLSHPHPRRATIEQRPADEPAESTFIDSSLAPGHEATHFALPEALDQGNAESVTL